MSLGSHKKKQKRIDGDDDWSVTTFATESPLKFREPFNRRHHRPKTQTSLVPRQISKTVDVKENKGNDEETLADSRDAPASQEHPKNEIRILHRSSSFQSLRMKMEMLTMRAFQRRNQFDRTTYVHNSLIAQSTKPDPQGEKCDVQEQKQLPGTNVEAQTCLYHYLSINSDKQDELPAIFREGTTGCVLSESHLQSRLMIESMALHLQNMTEKAKNSLKPLSTASNGHNLADEAAGFLNVLCDEIQATKSKLSRGNDEIILFLGDELMASTCGPHQTTLDFATPRHRMAPIQEGDAVEEMLESIEMGYEASLLGCGMTQ
jgi:hypothetical protein